MATNVRGYSIPVLNLSPGLDETKLAEVVTSVLLRAALSASTPWPKWILLAALELLHGRHPAPLDAAALSFLTQQSTAQTRTEGNIFDTADVADQHESGNHLIPLTGVGFHSVTSQEDELVTPILGKSTSEERASVFVNGEICKPVPPMQSELGDQKQESLKNTQAGLNGQTSPTNIDEGHVVRELIPNEDQYNATGHVNETSKRLVSKIILNTPTKNDLIETKNKHTGKSLNAAKLNYSTSTAFSTECPASTLKPSVQCVIIEDSSLERMDVSAEEGIGVETIVNYNSNDTCCSETLEPVLQLESTDSNIGESPTAFSRNRLTSNVSVAINDNTTSTSKLCPSSQINDHNPNNHQLVLESTVATLPAFDDRPTKPLLTSHILSSQQPSNQNNKNNTALLPKTNAPSNPATKVNILEKQAQRSTTTSISNKFSSSVICLNKACQTDRCKTSNVHTQAKVKMVTKWIQVKKKKFMDKAIQNSISSANTEIQTCNSLPSTEHISTQTDLAGVDGEVVIKRSSVVDKEAQTLLVYTNSVGVQVHLKKKSFTASRWKLTQVSGVPPSRRVTASAGASPDGEQEVVQLFHGRPLNRAIEKTTPVIPLEALEGLDAFLSDPRLQ